MLTTSLLNTIYFLLFSLFCSYAHHLLLALIPPKSEKREISQRLFPMMKHVHFAANVHRFSSLTRHTRYVSTFPKKKIVPCNIKLRRSDELFSLQRYRGLTCLCLALFPPEKLTKYTWLFKFQLIISKAIKAF